MSEKKENGLRLLALGANNFKGFDALEVEFDPDLNKYIFKGGNRSGKTSIIHLFHWLLNGNTEVSDTTIKDGQDSMKGFARFDKFKISRAYHKRTEGKKQRYDLKIEYDEGVSRTRAKQEFLDSLKNSLLNPSGFRQEDAMGKLKHLMEMKGVSFAEINAKIEELKEQRLKQGWKVDAYGDIEKVDKAEHVDTGDLELTLKGLKDREKDEIERIRQHNDRIDNNNLKKQLLSSRIEDARKDIERIEAELLEKKEKLNELCVEFDNMDTGEKREEKTEYDEEIGRVENAIADAERNNEKHKLYIECVRKMEALEADKEEYKKLDTRIKALRDEKVKKITQLSTGVPRLEARENGLYHDGVHSDNWSNAQSWQVAMQLCIAQNPDVKAVFIDGGESIGPDIMKEIEKFAVEHGIRLFVMEHDVFDTAPDDIPEGVFYILDGNVIGG